MKTVRIRGGGPAGSTAALAALSEGCAVEVEEKARFPRHKVCGEFLSPEIAPLLDRLGVLRPFLEANPWRVRRVALRFGRREKRSILSEPAYGLSRHTFDHLLWSEAVRRGAACSLTGPGDIVASGRHANPHTTRNRVFGFKAHYEGPASDAVELYFFDRAYVGISCVEQGRTNVCGLAPEETLRAHGFQPEALMQRSQPLRERLEPLQRAMKWLFTGPLDYSQHWQSRDVYLAGDALSFVDPFTGSGLLSAVLTGSRAGEHAARGVPVGRHLRICREALARPFVFSSALRRIAGTDWVEWLAPLIPGRLLFRLTRPVS